MQIVRGVPPIFSDIVAALPMAARPDVIFTWGNAIYQPGSGDIHESIIEHERVHGKRQGKEIEEWWRRYIADAQFRLDEEILAHRAEFEWHCRQPNADKPVQGFRSLRLYRLNQIAGRLSSPLYCGMITLAEAKKEILNGRR